MSVAQAHSHCSSLLQLYRSGFGAWATERFARRFAWEFERNPFASALPPEVSLHLDDDRVVAFLASYPIPVRISGRPRLMFCACDMVADDTHGLAAVQMFRRLVRKHAVLGTAVNDAVLKMFQTAGGRLIADSRVQFVRPILRHETLAQRIRGRLPRRIARWLPPGLIACLTDPLHLLRRHRRQRLRGPLPPGQTRTLHRFDDEYDALWRRASADYRNCVERTSTYMNWRYVDCPTSHPIIRGWCDDTGALRAVAVATPRVQLDDHGEPCGRIGEILEFVADALDEQAAIRLLEEMILPLARAGVGSIRCAALDPRLHSALQHCGFERRATDDQRLAISLAAEPGLEGDWIFSRGDGDACMATAL